MKRLAVVAVTLLSVLLGPPSARADSILNGGFEQPGLWGWTVERAAEGSLLFVGGHSGGNAAWFGAIGNGNDVLSQSFATSPGESYLLTFWLGHGATNRSNDFSVWWDNTPLLALTNYQKFGERQYSFVSTADDDETTLRFSGHELRDYYYLDDVTVTPMLAPAAPIPAPEPSTLALLFGGGLCLVARARARWKSASKD